MKLFPLAASLLVASVAIAQTFVSATETGSSEIEAYLNAYGALLTAYPDAESISVSCVDRGPEANDRFICTATGTVN